MKIHLLITCMAYAYFGFGFAVEMFGIKAGLGLTASIAIFTSSMVIFMIVVFTSMQKIKDVLYKKEDTPTPYKINTNE